MQSPILYSLDGCTFPAKPLFLEDPVYDKAVQALVRGCTDVLLALNENRSLYLPKRKIPFRGWWAFGGRMFPGESLEASAQRCLARESKLQIALSRFEFLKTNPYTYLGPKGFPQHDLTCVFVVRCTSDEIRAAGSHLDPDEYDTSQGFLRLGQGHADHQIAQPILDLYPLIFP